MPVKDGFGANGECREPVVPPFRSGKKNRALHRPSLGRPKKERFDLCPELLEHLGMPILFQMRLALPVAVGDHFSAVANVEENFQMETAFEVADFGGNFFKKGCNNCRVFGSKTQLDKSVYHAAKVRFRRHRPKQDRRGMVSAGSKVARKDRDAPQRARRGVLLGFLPHQCAHDEHNNTKKEHENRNLIDPVHHAEIEVALLLFKQVGRIQVMQNFL